MILLANRAPQFRAGVSELKNASPSAFPCVKVNYISGGRWYCSLHCAGASTVETGFSLANSKST